MPPIWSRPYERDTWKPHDKQSNMGGNGVHYALALNPYVSRAHDAATGLVENHSRAFTTDLPKIDPGAFDSLIDTTMSARRSLSDATFLIYDPAGFTVKLGSHGANPAFVLLHDGFKTRAVKITPGGDTLEKNGLAVHSAVIARDERGEEREGTVDLAKFIKAAARNRGLDPNRLKVSLLVANGGILKQDMPDEPWVGNLYHKTTLAEDGNKSEIIARAAVEGVAKGNVSAVLIEDIQPGKGTAPIAACVCDNHPKFGHAADNSITAMEKIVYEAILEANGRNAGIAAAYKPPSLSGKAQPAFSK